MQGSADDWLIQGNRIKLGPGGFIATSFSGHVDFDAPLSLTSSTGPFEAGSDAVLNFGGAITGSRLTKTGAGLLILGNEATNVSGTAVNQGILRVDRSMTLGSDVGEGTTVASGAVLELGGRSGTTVMGGLLTLNGGRLRSRNFVNTYNGKVVLGAASTISPDSGTLNLNRNIDNAGFLLTVTSAGTTVFGGTGVLSGAGGLTKSGTGTLILTGTGVNTYSGVTTVNVGVLRLEKPSALGAGGTFATRTSTAAAAILELAGGITVTAETLEYAGTTFPLRSRAGTNTWGGNIPLDATTTFIADTDPLRLTGVISGPAGAGLTKRGPSRLEITANNTYTGDTTIIEGTLRINGQQPSSRVVVFINGTLEGVGTVKGINSVEGKVSPGGGNFGTLTSLGNVAFDAASRFVAQVVPIAGVAPDRLVVTGAVTLNNATLQVVPPFLTSTSPGATFQIITHINDTDVAIGTFLNLPENSTFVVQVQGVLAGQVVFQFQSYRINYRSGTGNDVVLTYLNTAAMARDLAVTPAVLNEGEQVTLTGRLVDPDPHGVLTLQVNWGDGSRVETRHPGTDPFNLTHRYRDNPAGQPSGGQYRITVTWFDQHGAGNNRDLFVTVNNVAPAVAPSDPTTVRVGAMFARNGSFSDPGADTWTATVNYGDGSGVQPLDLNPAGRFTLGHRYLTPGTYTVLVTVRDDDGGIGTASFVVTVKSHHADDFDQRARRGALGRQALRR